MKIGKMHIIANFIGKSHRIFRGFYRNTISTRLIFFDIAKNVKV